MQVLLHEGHEHTETASAAVGPETVIVTLLGFLLVVALLGFVVKRYVSN